MGMQPLAHIAPCLPVAVKKMIREKKKTNKAIREDHEIQCLVTPETPLRHGMMLEVNKVRLNNRGVQETPNQRQR